MKPLFAMIDPGILVWKPSMHAASAEIMQNSTAYMISHWQLLLDVKCSLTFQNFFAVCFLPNSEKIDVTLCCS
jgi:hypothetical protein